MLGIAYARLAIELAMIALYIAGAIYCYNKAFRGGVIFFSILLFTKLYPYVVGRFIVNWFDSGKISLAGLQGLNTVPRIMELAAFAILVIALYRSKGEKEQRS